MWMPTRDPVRVALEERERGRERGCLGMPARDPVRVALARGGERVPGDARP
jgi:hypothetical protein